MIKAEVINRLEITDHIVMGEVQLEAKGKHTDLVAELESIISNFYENKDYQTEVLMIFEKLITNDLAEKSKKGEKEHDQSI